MQMTGVLEPTDGKFFLTDGASKTRVELRGADLAKFKGKGVQVTGSVILGAAATGGASQVVQVTKIEQLNTQDAKAAGLPVGAAVAGAGTSPSATAPPAIPPASATDPAKLAEPAPSPDKVPSTVPVDARTYVIGPEDDLSVSVWEQPQLSCTPCRVRSDGMITVPLINENKAAGLTLLELRRVITEALSAKALVDPQVTVSLLAAHSRKYYLYGQVRAPGAKELIMPTTVFEAIVSAGGFMDFANQKNIIIARGDKRFKFNFKEVMAGKNLKQNIYLESGDIIYVK